MYKLKNRLLGTVENKKGVVTIYVILWMAVLFPLLMFLAIDMTNYIYSSAKMKAVVDNAAASAITMIDEVQVESGIIRVVEDDAVEAVNTIMIKELNLNEDFTPSENSLLLDSPEVEVFVFNVYSDEGVEVDTPLGTKTLTRPTVFVKGEFEIKGLFYRGKSATLNRVGASQVEFGSTGN